MKRLAGKTAIITGAASGIGAAAVARMLEEGANIVAADLVEREAPDHPAVRHFVCDVGDHTQIDALIAFAIQEFGRIDILVNNAGMPCRLATTPEVRIEEWDQIIRVNLNSVFWACRAAIPHMQSNGGGAIIPTASIAGLGGDAGCHAYNATKAAVINFTRTLAIDHGPDGIRTNVVCPGPVATAMTAPMAGFPAIAKIIDDAIPLGRLATATEVANAIVFLASDEASFINGTVLTVDGGLSASAGNPNMMKAMQAVGA
jgi:meso-butanediol dehydrogenase/(S,S)-butanediol dehydrogenase/diacetyl reductase